MNMSDLMNKTTGQSPYDGFTINKDDVKKVLSIVNVKKVCWLRLTLRHIRLQTNRNHFYFDEMF